MVTRKDLVEPNAKLVLGHKASAGLTSPSTDNLVRAESLPFIPYGEDHLACQDAIIPFGSGPCFAGRCWVGGGVDVVLLDTDVAKPASPASAVQAPMTRQWGARRSAPAGTPTAAGAGATSMRRSSARATPRRRVPASAAGSRISSPASGSRAKQLCWRAAGVICCLAYSYCGQCAAVRTFARAACGRLACFSCANRTLSGVRSWCCRETRRPWRRRPHGIVGAWAAAAAAAGPRRWTRSWRRWWRSGRGRTTTRRRPAAGAARGADDLGQPLGLGLERHPSQALAIVWRQGCAPAVRL